VVFTTVQSVGAVILLAKLSAAPEVFFVWMAVTSALMSVTLRAMLWRIMPASDSAPRIDLKVMKPVWRFAAGNLGIGLTTSLLTQASGLIIAKYCSLDQLAAYTLAVSLASQVTTILSQPVSATLMPHFAHLIAQRDEARLASEYHRWTQITALLVVPVAGTLIVFAGPLLQLWLGMRSPLVAPVSELLGLVTIGTLLNAFVTPPYFLQIASGWTKLSAIKNVIALAIVLPALAIAIPLYGPIAAAGCWVGLNLGYYLFEVPYMHRRLLPRELWKWWGQDTMSPMLVGGVVYAITAALLPPMSPTESLLVAAAVAALAWLALVAVLPLARADVFRVLRLLGLRRFGSIET